jgi:OPA family glycerol-3-phosphate transporter-like MFS transporter
MRSTLLEDKPPAALVAPTVFGRAVAWFRPAPPIPQKSPEEVAVEYPIFRWRVFEATFIAYAAYYLVRNNLSPVQVDLGHALGYDNTMLGSILAASAGAYGIGKFVLGQFADRSNAKKFLLLGLLLTATMNFAFGLSRNFPAHLALWTLNGFVQGMGSGPCLRSLAHWYSVRERGTVFGIWNISHNIGGAAAGIVAAKCTEYFGWPSAFYVPGALALVAAGYVWFRMYDTPQSVGMPPVEEYVSGERIVPGAEVVERELSIREIFTVYLLPNRILWILACATFFSHIARYSIVDWGPTYLREVKGASLLDGGWSIAINEGAGVFGMLVMGWLSDRVGGRRGMISALSMLPLILGLEALILVPAHHIALEYAVFAVLGFFAYGPLMLMGVMSLDYTSKKAVATAGGFIALFGYTGRAIEGQAIGWVAQNYGWKLSFDCVIGCVLMGFILLCFTWNTRPRG